MKTKQRNMLLLLLTFCALVTGAATPMRRDVNPALLYFQAFGQIPELNAEDAARLGAAIGGTTIGADVAPEERALAARFDRVFGILTKVRAQKSPCDWGTDLSEGPGAYTPHLIKIRTLVNAALLRARVALNDGRQDHAAEELLIASALGRHAASDAVLVGVMMQYAVESNILDFLDAQHAALKPATRVVLAGGMKRPPYRSTVADAVMREKRIFHTWLLGRLEKIRGQKADDATVLSNFRREVSTFFSVESAELDTMFEASGRTGTGLLHYLRGAEAGYEQALRVARAQPEDVNRLSKEFDRYIHESTNLFTRIAMPNVGKARQKELDFEARLAALAPR